MVVVYGLQIPASFGAVSSVSKQITNPQLKNCRSRNVRIPHRLIGSSILALACSGIATAQDGPNLLPNPDFDTGDSGYILFGNAFLNNELTYEFPPFSM